MANEEEGYEQRDIEEARNLIGEAFCESETAEARNLIREARDEPPIPPRGTSRLGVAVYQKSKGTKPPLSAADQEVLIPYRPSQGANARSATTATVTASNGSRIGNGVARRSNGAEPIVGYLSIHAYGAKLTDVAKGKDVGHVWIAYRTDQNNPYSLERTAASFGSSPYKRSNEPTHPLKSTKQNAPTLDRWGNTDKNRPGVYVNFEDRRTVNNLCGQGKRCLPRTPNHSQPIKQPCHIYQQATGKTDWVDTDKPVFRVCKRRL